MAGPIAHIFCALALLKAGALTVDDPKAFIVGTTYPDIRLLAMIDRTQTHYDSISWQDVLDAKTSFQKGVKLHSLVDQIRIAQLETPLKNKLPRLPLMRIELLKFFEDSILYPKIENWPQLIAYFDNVIHEEKNEHHLSDQTLAQWHFYIKTYCAHQPSALSSHAVINQFPRLRKNIPLGFASLLSKAYVGIAFHSLRKTNAVISTIDHFYDNAVSLITSNAHMQLHAPALAA